jgi:hypothetical protein
MHISHELVHYFSINIDIQLICNTDPLKFGNITYRS